MDIEWRRPCVGLSSGLFQSPSYLLPQFVGAIAATVGASNGQVAWLAPLGFVLPLIAGLLMAAGDWFGGRAVIIGLACATSTGVGLLAAAGVAAAHDADTAALALFVAGACLVPAAVRHGAMVVAHETRGLSDVEQLQRSRLLRQFVVLGIYVTPLPAGVVADRCGWPSVFGALTVLELAALALLARILRAVPRAPRPSLAALFTDRRLGLAAAGAFFAQATVFAYVGGVPVRLAADGYGAATIGAVTLAAVASAFVVARPKSRRVSRFGRRAGAVPVAGVLAISAAGMLIGRNVAATMTAAVLFGLTSMLVELSKQWSQSLALVQARAGASGDQDYRRQAIVGLGANLGAAAGSGLGPSAALAGRPAWIALLLVAAVAAWTLQAAWFPRRIRERCAGWERWRHRGRDYVVVTGPAMLGQLSTAIYDASDDGDHIRLDRQRAAFDPAASTVEEQLERLRDR